MIGRFFIVLLVLTTGSGAVAQTIGVRSGEHSGFTRLVMLLPPRSEWSVAESQRSMALTIKLPLVEFDVSQVFSRIPRTRLVALSQNGPGSDLVFSLGCDCSVNSFIEKSGLLVIDIKDGKTRPKQRFPALNLPVNQNPYRFSTLPEPAKEKRTTIPKTVLPIVVGQMPVPKPSPLTTGTGTGTSSPPTRRINSRPNSTLNISEERLLAQINRASDQGLLDLREKPVAAGHRAMLPKTRSEMSAPEPGPVATQETPLPVSLSVTTVIDRDLASVGRSIDNSAPACLGSDRVALDDWAERPSFGAEISHWRAQLFGEFDKVNGQKAIGLARAYLHFGFGAEASQAIDLMPTSDKESQILKAMAQILDDGDLTGDNPFADQQHCDGDVALWALLAAQNVSTDANTNAIQMAFLRLPPHLRSFLGPRISEIFTEAGDGSMAKTILRAIARIEVEPGSGVALAKAAVAELQGDSETAGQELLKSLATGSQHSPEALVRLVANTYKSGGAVPPELYDLAAAYALEYRNTELGADLRRTQAIALALAGQLVDAFYMLPDIEKRDGRATQRLTLHPLLRLLTERADDVTFLRFALTSAQGGTDDVPPDTGARIARRLLELGFSESAWQWVAANETPGSDKRRYLRAEISLNRQLPNRAMAELLGLTGPRAAKLRARALWQQGEYQQAGEMFVAAQDFDEAARGYWMAENWDAAPEQANARYAKIVAGSVELRASKDNTTQRTPLAEARALMQNSTSARAGIEELLQAARVDDGP